MIRANFADSGIVVGQNDNNLTYLYGLSDFFQVMFSDTSTLNLLLEAESLVASEVYSRFLQFTSTLTLSGIQDATNSSLQLVYLSSTDAVQGQVNTYRLPVNAQSSSYIANKPFLPTELLDANVDYAIIQQSDGSSWIRFAQPLSSYSLPVRLLSDGVTQQYALWMVDAVIDEQLMSTYFGNLIGVSPENASSQFSDFVYGLFYVYMYGPNLDMLSRGLNLVLGIPVARAPETVLSIRQYLETDQYLVICDQNQYLIPYGLAPSVAEGDVLTVGQSLASWVELKDYQSGGDWWINLYIPEKLIPQLPAGQKDRYATTGSSYDFLMRNYLKAHTFLVNIKVTTFKNLQQFIQISDVIKRAKPAYAEAIYIWSLPSTEIINFQETTNFKVYGIWDEAIHPCISRLRRDNSGDPIIRGMHSFIRYDAANYVAPIIGADSYQSSYSSTFNGDNITGFINPMSQFRTNTGLEQGWVRAKLNRGEPTYRTNRTKIGFFRGLPDPSVDPTGVPFRSETAIWNVDLAYRVVPLYTTTFSDMVSKMTALGFPTPSSSNWSFSIFSPDSYSQAVNANAVDYLPPQYDPLALQKNYFFIMSRSTSVKYLGGEFAGRSFATFLPPQTDVQPGDYLLCVRITPTVVGVYWVTTSVKTTYPAYFGLNQIDGLKVTFNMPASRGGGANGAPYYTMRGLRLSGYNTVNDAINDYAIDNDPAQATSITSDAYKDNYNTAGLVIDRSKVSFVHAIEST